MIISHICFPTLSCDWKIVAPLREEKKLLKKRVFKLTLENKQRERFSVVCTSINSLNMNTIEWRTRQRVARGWITRQRDWVANITTSSSKKKVSCNLNLLQSHLTTQLRMKIKAIWFCWKWNRLARRSRVEHDKIKKFQLICERKTFFFVSNLKFVTFLTCCECKLLWGQTL